MKRSKKKTVRERTDREKAWAYIRTQTRVTVPSVVEHSPISMPNAQSLIQDLKREGLLTRIGEEAPNGATASWAIYHVAEDPPRLPSVVGSQSPAWRQQVWNALRIQRTCTVPDAMRMFSDDVDVAEDTVYRYVRKLEKAGIVLRRGRLGMSGQKGSYVEYAIHPRHERPNAYTTSELSER